MGEEQRRSVNSLTASRVGELSPDIVHVRAGIVSTTYDQSGEGQRGPGKETHGRSEGSTPSLGLTLLCTTNTANFVRWASRSDSGRARSSFSTSFCNSDTAYLTNGLIIRYLLSHATNLLTGVFCESHRFRPGVYASQNTHMPKEINNTYNDQCSSSKKDLRSLWASIVEAVVNYLINSRIQ